MEVVRLQQGLELAPLENGPPGAFRIFPFGKIETTKGVFRFDEEAARRVIAAWRDYGNRLPIDYEHQIFDPVTNGPVPAAGWFDLELREDGLWAVNVEWTPRAVELLKNREYRYFSPTFRTDDEGRIVELVNVALVNLPATKRMEPLVAKAVPFEKGEVVDGAWDADKAVARVRKWASKDGSGEKETIDWRRYAKAFAYVDGENPENFGAYKLPHHDVRDGRLVVHRRGVIAAAQALMGARGGVRIPEADRPAVLRHIAGHYHQWGEKAPWEREERMKVLLKALGLKEDAGEAEALQALTRMKGALEEVVALTGKEDAAEALGVVRAWKEAAEKVEALSKRVAELEAEREAREREALIQAGLKEGKLTKALAEKWAKDVDLKTLKAYLEAAPRIVRLGEEKEPASPKTAGKKWEEMTPMEKHKLYLENPELYQALKTDFETRKGGE